jgi:HlyD family secretion protein
MPPTERLGTSHEPRVGSDPILGPRRLSPDPAHLQAVFRLTPPAAWIFLALLFAWAGSVLTWSVVGRLPFRVQGIGVFMLGKGAVFDVPAPGTGTVQALYKTRGESVHIGELLASVSQKELEAKRVSAQILVADLRAEIGTYRASAEQDTARRRQNLADRLAGIAADQVQLHKNESFLSHLNDVQQAELRAGYVTREQLEQTFSQLIAVQQSIRESESQVAQLKTAQLEFEDQVQQTLATLGVHLVEAENTLRETVVQLANEGQVFSPCDGNIVEVATEPGALVSRGTQLFVIDSGDRALSVVGYLPISGGKQVLPGMTVEVSPTSIERSIYGTIRGQVTSVSALAVTREGLLATLGNADLVSQMMASGAPIELQIALATDPHTASGLAWSSETGPPVRITAGGTAAIAVIVKQQRPIDLLLPIERTWFSL